MQFALHPSAFRRAIIELLSDTPRSGSPRSILSRPDRGTYRHCL
ncbi:hypothetical protein [Gimesia maris]